MFRNKNRILKILYTLTIGIFISPFSWAGSLYVFVPTEIRANVMQQEISELCKGIDVTVFGRAKDFHKEVKKNSPNAILSLLPVIERTGDYNTILKGIKGGAESEDYVLVSVDKPLEITNIKDKKIGVVDLLGRKPMGIFVSQLFQTDVKIKRVTKVADLLSLLTFGTVDGIFISDALYNELKSKSNLKLVATNLNVKVGLVSAALNDNSLKEKITRCILNFNNELNTTLGVEQWRAL